MAIFARVVVKVRQKAKPAPNLDLPQYFRSNPTKAGLQHLDP